jgi:S-DNA-T family DNA segregation ATPase FtsK/SpoIIIE
MISQALAHLGISPLDRFFKAGGELVYTVPARVDGEGTYAQIRLPMGATADMVAAKRTTLAANLGRATLETWPTQGEEAGILELWIADKGKLGGGAGPWPLLHEGSVDVFEGVPIGKTQRGQLIYGHFFERNWIVGGRPGQGKTALVRILVLGAALDPTAELWVFVIAQNTDFRFTPPLSCGFPDQRAHGPCPGRESGPAVCRSLDGFVRGWRA